MLGRLVRRLLAPLVDRLTYRRWAGLILGGALLMPYMMAADVLFAGVRGAAILGTSYLADPVTFVGVLPVVALTGLVLPIRAMAISAARALFGVRLDAHEADAQTWPQRWRTAAWFTAQLGLGGIVSGLTLAMPPFAVWLCSVPFTGDWLADAGFRPAPEYWSAVWMLPLGLLIIPALVYVAAGAGVVLARLAPIVLGPTPEDRLAAAERRSTRLAERNRLARELHDSVGHALSVVTVQAAAAGRVLSADPEFARDALGAIESSARGALEDLDYVLGLLREEEAPDAPEPTLASLDELVRSTGLPVRYDVRGPVDQVPRTVSREAYRIVQEGLTNALRHGDHPTDVALRVAVVDEHLEVEMTNASTTGSGRTRPGGGRGLRGMRERVELLRGEFDAGPVDGHWRLRARFPLRASGVRP